MTNSPFGFEIVYCYAASAIAPTSGVNGSGRKKHQGGDNPSSWVMHGEIPPLRRCSPRRGAKALASTWREYQQQDRPLVQRTAPVSKAEIDSPVAPAVEARTETLHVSREAPVEIVPNMR